MNPCETNVLPDGKKVCNLCGTELSFWDLQEDFLIHKSRLGYGTAYDGDSVELHLCCSCFEKLVGACAVNPIRERDF